MSFDIRHNFIKTLDHFPSELVRTLWTIQSLDFKCDSLKDTASDNDKEKKFLKLSRLQQAIYLENLVKKEAEYLEDYKNELSISLDIRKRHERNLNKKSTISEIRDVNKSIKKAVTKRKGKKLLIKINLKKHKDEMNSQIRQDIMNETLKVSKIDPNEPRYCNCNDISYGQMIACDNEKCPIEWFHYGCVGLTKAPSSEWFCSDSCREIAHKTNINVPPSDPVLDLNDTNSADANKSILTKKKKKRRKRFY
ncbi:hypothetical protein TPHA_0J01370 [Tetrapisispora phaffii CBS 4417]|uniref:Inhibitor of growth protein 3 n=1 Tax=Tetrapisispora phaffii (strain ATCC 24235 / CBS 4417 / NBRC 1672 / NRRL Y-8282 / UCD 70-5) TaxID=1071381 RepID=G8BYL7_TETPH|nr:hypothetical protein TPHA_0J01370 [Tetrapisispora phaffii CBS 4417]CCE64959.1 hypothetical protein TPHA_0J01370 [Tetrapisispora phaffii CBS 4417]